MKHQLLQITEQAAVRIFQKKTVRVLLDVKPAFDKAWYNLHTDYPKWICIVTKSYLIKLGRKTSNEKRLVAGVPQEAYLVRYLYIFTDEISRTHRINLAIFADHTTSSGQPAQLVNQEENKKNNAQ